ncbi:hypothetical protein QZH41_003348 [Actinostola sp. cb2023]|nr:hypothetical protein QZH41_003348 [Actinostola sp. cb2023]
MKSLPKVQQILLQICVYSQLVVLFQAVAVFSWPDEDSKSSYFQREPLRFMDKHATTTIKVADIFGCQLLCLRESSCFAIIFARNPDDGTQLYHCSLFDSQGNHDEFYFTDLFDVYTKVAPKSCSHAKFLGYHESKHYVIDPDGPNGAEQPFSVYCNMTSHNGIGVTVVSHNSEDRTLVDGCESNGCYRRDVVYDGISSDQLRALTSISTHCEQYIKYECMDALLLYHYGDSQMSWLVSRDGRQMKYWGDSGLLNNKEDLPVISLRFGDIGDSGEQGYHTLGKLRCYEEPSEVSKEAVEEEEETKADTSTKNNKKKVEVTTPEEEEDPREHVNIIFIGHVVTPDSNSLTDDSDSLTPDSDSLTPDSDSLTADSDSLTFDSNSLTADSDYLTPDSDSLTPDSNSLTFDSDSLTADIDSLTADSDSLTPDSDSLTPDSDSLTPDSDS